MVLWWCRTENDDYTGSKHDIVYKYIAISICSCCDVFFYQEYSFTQLTQAFTFKNKADTLSVQYKLENYIVCIKISEIKKTVNKQDSNLIIIRDPFKSIPSFSTLSFFSCSSHTHYKQFTSRCMYHTWSYLMQTKFMDSKLFDIFVTCNTTTYIYKFG